MTLYVLYKSIIKNSIIHYYSTQSFFISLIYCSPVPIFLLRSPETRAMHFMSIKNQKKHNLLINRN